MPLTKKGIERPSNLIIWLSNKTLLKDVRTSLRTAGCIDKLQKGRACELKELSTLKNLKFAGKVRGSVQPGFRYWEQLAHNDRPKAQSYPYPWH